MNYYFAWTGQYVYILPLFPFLLITIYCLVICITFDKRVFFFFFIF